MKFPHPKEKLLMALVPWGGGGAQMGEEKTVLAPRSTLTSELTWSKGLMPAYYRKGTYVSPGPSGPAPPQSPPGTRCKVPSVSP